MAKRRLLPYGPTAVIVECADTAEVLGLASHVRSRFSADIIECIPGALTVTVVGHRSLPESLLVALADDDIEAFDPAASTEHTIDVVYDGNDVAWIAGHLGLSADDVIAAHTGQTWTVAFCGFAPGFGYLLGDGVSLDVPRLDRPRPRVPAGSVALAGAWSTIYPSSSPGGWRLIGRTETAMWNGAGDRPALLAPGDRVRFRAVD